MLRRLTAPRPRPARHLSARPLLRGVAAAVGALFAASLTSAAGTGPVLRPEPFAHYVERFNAMEPETVVNAVPNAAAWDWMQQRIPLFECPASDVEEIYYFRWWALRKQLRKDASGRFVFTEFITKSRPISSALGHHLMEGRWLRDQAIYDDYVAYWLRGKEGKPQEHLHKYSSWLQYALYQRFLVTQDTAKLTALLPDLVADYEQWEAEKRLPSGLFWQYDVRDAMEESISGGRTAKNIRPTINSYMFGNAEALTAIATLAGKADVAERFRAKAAELRRLTQETLWNPAQAFFEVRREDGSFADVREAIGFIPWYFNLPETKPEFLQAWTQFADPQGFKAPFGITTAERRHPQFRSHGVGTCEWDGAVWPFATSQTLVALANALRNYPGTPLSNRDYFDAFLTYVRSQRFDGKPYIGEYLDETTGQWLKGRDPRSSWYNHSTFADLLITGVVGLVPRADDTLELLPLLPVEAWDWFCLDGVQYHGRRLTVVWDRSGARYGRGAGLHVFVDGVEIARADTLKPLSVELPKK